MEKLEQVTQLTKPSSGTHNSSHMAHTHLIGPPPLPAGDLLRNCQRGPQPLPQPLLLLCTGPSPAHTDWDQQTFPGPAGSPAASPNSFSGLLASLVQLPALHMPSVPIWTEALGLLHPSF